MGARLYDPSQARFTTQDTLLGSPTDPLTLNQYIYAGDSPLDNSDPTGNSFACAGQQCDAAQTVAYHAVQAIDEAENRGDSQQAGAYYAQAANWFTQAAATPAPAPAAPKAQAALAALPTGWTFRSNAHAGGVHGEGNYCVAADRTEPSCFSQPEVPSSSWQEQAVGAFNILALALTPLTDGGSDEAALELDAVVGSTEEGTEGFSSFSAAKTALGSPGEGNVYDHVVEQSQIGRSGFSPEQIHNPDNLNPVSAEVNQLKANYYSTKQPFTNGGTVRDWLTGQPFEDQFGFGQEVTEQIQNGDVP
jgi:hypothetical protein